MNNRQPTESFSFDLNEQSTFKFSVLDSKELIEEACGLLYAVYIEQGNWKFADENPSGLRIEVRNGRNILVDRYTDTARWFGVFYGETLIGCARLHGLDETGRYEIEGYPSSQVVQPFLPRENCVEMGKVAVSIDYRGKRVINFLYLSVFEYCQRNKLEVFGCVSNTYIKSIFQRIRLLPKIERAFKYEETDPVPVNFYLVKLSDYKEINANLRRSISSSQARYNVLDALDVVAPIMPTPLYWHDDKGVVLGINELCLKGMGAEDRYKIIGHTPYEFYPRDTAEHIMSHNDRVIKTEQVLEQDELINNFTTGELVYAKAIKVPLYDDNGNVIGVIGTSVDLTSEKLAERLKLESEKQKAVLIEKEKFVSIARKFAHDISSPLATLKLIGPMFKDAPEPQRVIFEAALNRAVAIADTLLASYRDGEDFSELRIEERREVCLREPVASLVDEKKVQFESGPIQLTLLVEDNALLARANVQVTEFERCLSNLINNGADALGHAPGKITVHLEADSDQINLTIHDTGKGMSEPVRQRILAGKRVTDGKPSGNGMGIQQVWDFLNQNEGSLAIHSELGNGTTFRISLPRSV